jgi:hypothetical protein
MTQTTEERIATIINEGVTGECDGAITGQMSTAQIIAAEIDNLRERNAFLLASAEAAQAQLAECRAAVNAEIDRRHATEAALAAQTRQVDALRRELAEARAQIDEDALLQEKAGILARKWLESEAAKEGG